MYRHTPQKRLMQFLSGTTCDYRYKVLHWVSPSKRFAILRHLSHSSYCDRATGTKTCKAFYVLVDCDSDARINALYEDGYIMKHEGRMTREILQRFIAKVNELENCNA